MLIIFFSLFRTVYKYNNEFCIGTWFQLWYICYHDCNNAQYKINVLKKTYQKSLGSQFCSFCVVVDFDFHETITFVPVTQTTELFFFGKWPNPRHLFQKRSLHSRTYPDTTCEIGLHYQILLYCYLLNDELIKVMMKNKVPTC